MEMLEDMISQPDVRSDSRRLILPSFMANDRGAQDIVNTALIVFKELFNYQGEITDTIDGEWWVIQFTDKVDTTNMSWETLSQFLLRLTIRLSELYTYEQWFGDFEYVDTPGDYAEGIEIRYEFSNETIGSRNIKIVSHRHFKVPIDDELEIREVQRLISERNVTISR